LALTSELSKTNLSSLKILSLNVNGLGRLEKRQKLLQTIKTFPLVCLQETHSRPGEAMGWLNFKGYDKVESPGTGASKGVIIMARKNLNLTHLRQDDGRLVSATVVWENSTYQITNVYAPNVTNTRASTETYKQFLGRLRTHLTLTNFPKVLSGDMNVIMDSDLDTLKGNATSFFPELIDEWDAIKQTYQLDDVWRLLKGDEFSYTFHPGGLRQIYRRLDYIFTSDNLRQEVAEIEHRNTPLSDHRMIVLTITKNPKNPPFRLWKHDDFLLRFDDYKNAIEEAINDGISDAREANLDSAATWEYLKYKIRITARQEEKRRREVANRDLARAKIINSNIKDYSEEEVRWAIDTINRDETDKLQRLALASRVKWYEENEKSTKYFYRKIKQNRDINSVIKLRKNGALIEGDLVNKEVELFYKDLYASRQCLDIPLDWEQTGIVSDELTNDEKAKLGADLTEGSLKQTLFKKMKTGKSPGNDGLTVAFYRCFWTKIKRPLLQSFEAGFAKGELSSSQKQSVIRLIRKKGKDPEYLKNWTPISLMNVDTKILSRTLAQRLEEVLPKLINNKQLGFVKGRYMQEGNMLIEQLVHKYTSNDQEGLVAGVDFQKAFDSVSHKYIFDLLPKLGFPNSFTEKVATLYSNAESCVINNSLTTKYFDLGRSCRQGDPIAPYLFIIAINPLLNLLDNDDRITGLRTPTEEIKLSAYADDITLLLKDDRALETALETIENFGRISGLELNRDKTVVMPLDPRQIEESGFEMSHTIEVTGVTHSNREGAQEAWRQNFDIPVAKTRLVLNEWRERHLTLLGRIQVVKAFGISPIMHKSWSLEIPAEIIKEISTMIYKFIWHGPDRLPRLTLEGDWEVGGMSLTQPETQFNLNVLKWLTYWRNSSHPWKSFLSENDIRDIDIQIGRAPPIPKARQFSLKCRLLKAGIQLSRCYMSTKINLNTTVSKNRHLRDRRLKTIDIPHLERRGIYKVRHWIDHNGDIIRVRDLPRGALNFIEQMEWAKVVSVLTNTLPRLPPLMGWEVDIRSRFYPDHGKLTLVINGELITKFDQKSLLNPIRNNEVTQGAKQLRALDYNQLDAISKASLWGKCKLIFRDTSMRDFCFRVMNGLLFSSKDLLRFGTRDTDVCPLCRGEEQTVEHLLWECNSTQGVAQRLVNDQLRANSYSPDSRLRDLVTAEDSVVGMVFLVLYRIYISSIKDDPATASDRAVTNWIKQYLAISRHSAVKCKRLHKFLHIWGNIADML